MGGRGSYGNELTTLGNSAYSGNEPPSNRTKTEERMWSEFNHYF